MYEVNKILRQLIISEFSKSCFPDAPAKNLSSYLAEYEDEIMKCFEQAQADTPVKPKAAKPYIPQAKEEKKVEADPLDGMFSL